MPGITETMLHQGNFGSAITLQPANLSSSRASSFEFTVGIVLAFLAFTV
jgi:hypothetical protein